MKNRIKDKRKKLMCCLLALTTMLTGCSLAKEYGLESENASLIGVYVTTKEINPAGDELFPGEPENEGKIFAELKEYTDINTVTGESSQILRYEFSGTEGYELFLVTVKEPDGSSYVSLKTSDVFSSIQSLTVEEELSSIEGMIYVAPDFSEILYMNPVYQNSRGEVFMTKGSGYDPSSHIVSSQGERFSMTISEKYKETVNGESSISGMSVTIKVGVKFRPAGINIIQMDAESRMTDLKKYPPDALPEKIFPEQKTQYIIFETYSFDYEGKSCVNREIIEAGREYVNSFLADETGVFNNLLMYIVWPDSAAGN